MKLRIKFGKKGAVRFIGHLDIMRYFQKALRRAGFDLTYTRGFHPHPVLSFAAPLGLGLESCGEYMDLEVDSLTSTGSLTKQLNLEMAEGIDIFHISLLREDAKNAMASLAAADYQVRFRPMTEGEHESERPAPPDTDALQEMVRNFLDKDSLPVEKKTKKGTARIDLRPLVHELYVREDGSLFMKLHASSAANVRPELLVCALTGEEAYLTSPHLLFICRLEMYAQEGEGEESCFIPFYQYQAVSE